MANKNTLMVEGKDDLHVVIHICRLRGMSGICDVEDLGNDAKLLESIPIRLRFADEGDVIGVVIDADDDQRARWDAVRGRLAEAGFANLPAQLQPAGTIIDAPDTLLLRRAGVWVMPDNRGPGKLENLLLSMIPEDDELLEHVTSCVKAIANPRFRQVDAEKAVIHTWLAWQEQPGRPYGTSIASGFLNHNVPEVDSFVAWLRGLFT